AGAVAAANGVELGDYTGFPIRTYLEKTEADVLAIFAANAARLPPPGQAKESFPSMVQDLVAGRPLEVDAIFADVVERAARVGVADADGGSATALVWAIGRAGLKGKRVGVESGDASAHHLAALDRQVSTIPLDDHVAAQRRIKDADELTLIRAAAHCNDVGFGAVASAVGVGRSEFDVHNAMVKAMQDVAGVPIDMTGPNNAFISGPRTML